MKTLIKATSLVLRLMRGGINRLWVQPLESRVIPRLAGKRANQFPNLLLRLASWCASAGRVVLEETRVGITRWSGPDWSVTYIGNGFSAEALRCMLLPEIIEEKKLPPVFLWQVPRRLRKFTAGGDLVVCELNKIVHPSPRGIDLAFITPQSVKQVLEGIDRPVDEILAGMNQHTRSRIRHLQSQGFTYEVTRSQADFDLFYHRMYLPYIQARFCGRGAVVRGYDFIHRNFSAGVMVLVKQGQEPVCGALCKIDGDTCKAGQMGVLDGQYERVKGGSNVALWWSVLLWAREQGARRYDLGSSLPHTSDGVYQFKRHWGAHVYTDQEAYSQWNFFGQNLSTKLREHLNGLGLLAETAGGFYRVVLLEPAKPPREEELAGYLQNSTAYQLDGILSLSAGEEKQLISNRAVEPEPEGHRPRRIQPFATP